MLPFYGSTLETVTRRWNENAWADGVPYIDQCPVEPGSKHVYRFQVCVRVGVCTTMFLHMTVTRVWLVCGVCAFSILCFYTHTRTLSLACDHCLHTLTTT